MTRRKIAISLAGMVFILGLIGCSTNTDLSGSLVPNSRPDTRLTGQPPTLLEAGFKVEFHWTGSDPDGRVAGYQWKISNNGVDGISPRDTLTRDPLTGAEIHPWHFTTATDTSFFVLADQEDFPGDPEDYERSFRTHSLFVRTVDDKGGVDPSPALISFTSTTLVPTCLASFAGTNSSQSSYSVPSTVNLDYEGFDEDFELGVPTHIRVLWVPAEAEDDSGDLVEITNAYRYYQYVDELIDFTDPLWSTWIRYADNEEDRRVSFPDRPDGKYFLFAVQARDTAGALSIGKTYNRQVMNVRISANQFKPTITAREVFLGLGTSQNADAIAANQPLNFQWTTTADNYAGTVVSMRHGWDLLDVEDPNDPGWAVPPGLSEQNRFAEERIYSNGEHVFWIRVVDDSGSVNVLKWTLTVIPFVSRENQLNLVFADQVVDDQTNRWPDETGTFAYDKEDFRNAFWEFLDNIGGIENFSTERDRFNHTSQEFDYEVLVNYKAALINARTHGAQTLFIKFRPDNTGDKFVWLGPYQKQGGNVFLIGDRSMESFLEVDNYMVPIIFDSAVEDYTLAGESFVVGFGTNELNDGTEVMRGPLMYPYATAGITALDWNIPLNKNIYGRVLSGDQERKTTCSGIKQLELVPEFRSNHLVGPGAISDVINTHEGMDWRDPTVEARLDTMLLNEYPFTGDEFIDDKIADRPTAVIIQQCDMGYQGNCVEPMFTGVARMDWMRNKIWEAGDDAWPGSIYTDNELKEICGEMALTTYVPEDGGDNIPLASARVSGKVFGYLSYKTVEDKPVQNADVYWGFDPYRFDHNESRKAILWVMEYFGLPIEHGGPVTP